MTYHIVPIRADGTEQKKIIRLRSKYNGMVQTAISAGTMKRRFEIEDISFALHVIYLLITNQRLR